MALKDFFKTMKRVVSKAGGMTMAIVMGISPMASAAPLYSVVDTNEAPIVQYVKSETAETGAEPKIQVSDFKDNIGNHWGAGPIQWGLDKNMVGGYPDGTFLPDRAVTEAEFAVMLARYADNTDKTFFSTGVTNGHWSQEYYNSLMDFLLPLNGYMDNTDTVKNTSISRVRVAQVFAAKYGFNLGEQQAVYFLYENGLSQGRTAMNYEGYAPNAYLTRAEIVQFFKNVDNQGTKQLTFLGQKSVKGACDADTIVGIQGVAIDNTPVDFTKWVPAVSTGITTKIENGKVVAVMNKVTTPIKLEGHRGSYVNYVDFSKGATSGSLMNNSIVLYNGTELPASDDFRLPEDMLKGENAESLGGIVGIAYDGNGLMKTGSFMDKAVFREYISNLQYFSASQAQIDKCREIFDKQAGVLQKYGNTEDIRLYSTKKNSTMLVTYGDRNFNISMYSGRKVTLGTEIVVD